MPKLAAVLITNNEEANIGACLDALQTVVKEILVVDSHSTDNTVSICEKRGIPVIVRKWEGYAKTKNFANSKVDADWILSVDADEVLSEELCQSILTLNLEKGTVYSFDRINNFCGQWIKHSGWYPDWKVRLFNKQDCYWVGDFVHEKLKYGKGTVVQKIEGKLYHYSYKSLEDHTSRMHRYAQLAAEEMHQKGVKGNFVKIGLSASVRFFRTFILRLGFLDGKMGWIISCRNAKMVKLKYQKLRELNKKQS